MFTPRGNESALNMHQMQDTAMDVVETICGVISRPVDLVLRPFHGTQYFTVPVIFLSTGMMIFLPVFSALATSIVSMIPLARMRPPVGLFGIGSLTALYFLVSFIHSIRIYQLMIHPERERFSEFEGPPLPFFYLFPKGNDFWFTRIVLEPAFILFAALVLGHIFIFQSGLVLYLEFAAMSLAMKGFIGWFRSWQYMRRTLDTVFMGPIIARLIKNQASDDDRASLHLSSFPKDLPEDVRRAAALHIARVLSPEANIVPTENSPKEGESK